jgi:hypothetical protein
MRNQSVRKWNRYSAPPFDIRGQVKAIHYDLAFKQENKKFVMSDKQLVSIIGTNWKQNVGQHVRVFQQQQLHQQTTRSTPLERYVKLGWNI